MTPEQERSEYNAIVEKTVQQLKELGFEHDPEPATRGHKNPNVFIRTFPKGRSMKISFCLRTTQIVLGLPVNPYLVTALEMQNDFQILNKWESKPRTLKGFAKAARDLLRDLPSWARKIEKNTAAA